MDYTVLATRFPEAAERNYMQPLRGRDALTVGRKQMPEQRVLRFHAESAVANGDDLAKNARSFHSFAVPSAFQCFLIAGKNA